MKIQSLSVSRILDAFGNPYKENMFDLDRSELELPVSMQNVLANIKQGLLETNGILCVGTIDWHERRIAALVVYGWNNYPIELDVGIPSLDFYEHRIIDGVHRLAAAIVLGKKRIKSIISGELSYAKELLREKR